MLITFMYNSNIESDNKNLISFIHLLLFSLSYLLLLLADNFSVCLPLTHFPGPRLLSYAFIPLLDLCFLISLVFCICLWYFLFLCEFCCPVQFPFCSLCVHEFYFSVTFSSSSGIPVQIITFQW